MSVAIFIDKTRANLRFLNGQLTNKNILIIHRRISFHSVFRIDYKTP